MSDATSIESICINDEEENSDTEHEPDSDLYSASDEECFSLVQELFQYNFNCMKVIKRQ